MKDKKRKAVSKPPVEDPDETILDPSGPADEIYRPDAAEYSRLPRKIKVDLSTALEIFLISVAGLSAFSAFIFFVQGIFGGKHSPPDPALLKYIPVALVIMAAAFACWRRTDNYYIINSPKRKLLYHFKLFNMVKITSVADFEEILAIGVTGVRHTHFGNVWWNYKICVVKNNGKFIDLSNEHDLEKIIELNFRAKKMAAAVGCLFAEGAERSKLLFDAGSSELRTVSFEEEIQVSFSDSIKRLSQKFSPAFLVAVTLIVVAIFIMIFILLTMPI